MVNATCGTCGAKLKFDDADVPPSGKITACGGCGADVTVMPMGATAMGLPGPVSPGGTDPRRSTMAGLGGALSPAASQQMFGGGPKQVDSFFGDGVDLADLPAPKRSSPLGGTDARPRPESRSPLDGLADLPAPKRPSGGPLDLDLPAPKRASGPFDAGVDLPAPVGPHSTRSGGFDAPAGGRFEFPDDLPAPVGPHGTNNTDLPAPKGFFDDVPAPKRAPFSAGPSSATFGGDGLDLPAPKGFFDDVPALPLKQTALGMGAPAGGGLDDGLDLPAPKGFFDDAPGPKSHGSATALGMGGGPAHLDFGAPRPSQTPSAPAPSGGNQAGVLDLDDLELEPSRMTPLPTADRPNVDGRPPGGGGRQGGGGVEPFDLGQPHFGGAPPSTAGRGNQPVSLDLDDPEPAPSRHGMGPASMPLELGDDVGMPPSLDDMDLEAPSTGANAGGLVTFAKPSPEGRERAAAESQAPPMSAPSFAPMRDADLELDENDQRSRGKSRAAAGGTRSAAGTMAADVDEIQAVVQQSRRKKLIAGAIVASVAAGAVAYFLFMRWQADKALAQDIAVTLELARKALDSDRWAQAASAGEKILQMTPSNQEARGLAAQAHYAQALDSGVDASASIKAGEAHFQKIQESGDKAGIEVQKARGLRQITERNGAEAVLTLQAVTRERRKDSTVLLFLGWAYAADGRHGKAIEAFDASLKQSENRLPALYGLGQAYFESGDSKAAKAAFLAVLDQDNSHIGAQVGLAQLVDPEQREPRLLEILQRKNLAQADPRAVSRCWALAGNEALRVGKVDEAKARFGKSLELEPGNVAALVGQAKAALARGKVDDARDLLRVVLKQRPTDAEALITYAEASLAAGDLAAASKSIGQGLGLAADNWRAHEIHGRILDANPAAEPGAAEDAYRQAIELAGDDQIDPVISLVHLLVKQDRGAEAVAILEPIEAAAENDPVLALTLGVAYLGTGDANRGESWFRKSLARRPGDIEAQLQLGLALLAQQRFEEAIDTLKRAYESDLNREDIGARLVIAYDMADNAEGSAAVCESLLGRTNVSINVRSRCGRFYARTGQVVKAAALGESILAEDHDNAAGHFLRGEGLYYTTKDYIGAQKEYRDAVRSDEQAQYFEALGRATEGQQLFDEALKAYQRAAALDPKYFPARLGRGRIRVARREYPQAIEELQAALELDASNAMVYYHLGQAHYYVGDQRKAADALERAVKLDGDFAHAHYLLGMAYFDLGRKEAPASAAFAMATKSAEGTEPWVPEAYRLLGMTLRLQNRSCEAAKAFRSFLDLSRPGSAETIDARRMQLEMDAKCR